MARVQKSSPALRRTARVCVHQLKAFQMQMIHVHTKISMSGYPWMVSGMVNNAVHPPAVWSRAKCLSRGSFGDAHESVCAFCCSIN